MKTATKTKFRQTEIGMIPEDWEIESFGECISTLTDYHANGSYKILKQNVELLSYEDYAIMIRTTNFEKNDFFMDLRYINKHAYEFLDKSKVKPFDIIMNKIANAGSVYLMAKLEKPVSLGMNLFLIRVKNIDQKYAYYFLKNNENYIKSFAQGSVTKTITKKNVKTLKIAFPKTIEEQKAISNFLFNLQQKIELNQRMNKTLEAIGKAIFKHWFIDFEFPNGEGKPYKSSGGGMVDSELGEIPKGWMVGIVSDLVYHSKNSIKPFEYPDNTFYHYSIEAFDGKGIPTIELGQSILSNKFVVKENSILVSKLNPRIPRVWAIEKIDSNAICSTEFQVMVPKKDEIYGYCYSLFISNYFRETMKSRVTGTSGSHQRIRPEDILNISIIIPPNNILLKFETFFRAVISKVESNLAENEVLSKVRDALLPKLMSGQIRVPLEVR